MVRRPIGVGVVHLSLCTLLLVIVACTPSRKVEAVPAPPDIPAVLEPSAVPPTEPHAQSAPYNRPEALLPRPDLPPPTGAIGYGRRATGGEGGEEVWVTSLADSGPGTLREAASRDGSTWIRFAVAGTIRLRERVRVTSDTTVDGRGTAVTISGDGLWIARANNVIVTGLTFTDGRNERHSDAIWVFDGSHDIWIDHNDFSDYADGLVDITWGATDVTVSWNRFSDHGKTILIMWPPPGEDVGGTRTPMRVTLHHNWFNRTETRNPMIRYAQVHAFNNFVDDWRSYGMEAQVGSQLRSEGNIFWAGPDTRAIISRDTPADHHTNPGRGAVRSDDDLLLGGATVTERDRTAVFDPSEDYPYAVDPADQTLIRVLLEGAGAQ